MNRLFPVLVGVFCAAMPCLGQAGRAELFGVISDPAGLAVPKAKVAAEDQATMARYAVITDDRGEYHLLGLPA
ncbi:MAG TPA: carboxypeptidase-like regulatory domain-containing protein, partial [Candidatus Acidoferrales bacterium]|nr:carboxypeptidase-like regulatory domain-containing protein [Candidatus Acidoferrales bacterium]